MNVAVDTGNPNDRITSDTTLTVSDGPNSFPVGTLLKVYSDGVLVGSDTAAANGAFSVTTSVLSDGSHLLTITSTPTSGSESSPTSLGVWVIDSTNPNEAFSLNVQNDTGLSLTDRITKDNLLVVSGKAEAWATVKVYDSITGVPVVVGTASANISGNFSINLDQLLDGEHVLSVKVIDVAGNESTLTSLGSWLIDTIPPGNPEILSVTDDTGGSLYDRVTKDDSLTVLGLAENFSIVKIYDTISGIRVLVGQATADENGLFSVTTYSLSDGFHQLIVTATDLAGNESEATSLGLWLVDTVPPSKPIVSSVTSDTGESHVDKYTTDHNLTIYGKADPFSKINVYDTITGTLTLVGTGYSNYAGDYTVVTNYLENGRHPLYVVAEDLAGNESSPQSIGVWTIHTSSSSISSSSMSLRSEGVAYNLCYDEPYEVIGTYLECSLCKAGWPMKSGRVAVSFYGKPCLLDTGNQTFYGSSKYPAPSWFWGFEQTEIQLSCIPTPEGKEYPANVWIGRQERGSNAGRNTGGIDLGAWTLELLVRFEQVNTELVNIQLKVNVFNNGYWLPFFSTSTSLYRKGDPFMGPGCLPCGRAYESVYIPVSTSNACPGDLKYIKISAGTAPWFEGCGPIDVNAFDANFLSMEANVPRCGFFNGKRLFSCFRAMTYSKTDPPEFYPTFSQLGYNVAGCAEKPGLTNETRCTCLAGIKGPDPNQTEETAYVREFLEVGCPNEGDHDLQKMQVGVIGGSYISPEGEKISLGSWLIDTEPPDKPTVTSVNYDRGSSASDKVTNDNTLTIVGHVNTTVELCESAVGFVKVYDISVTPRLKVGQQSLSGSGNFSVTTNTLDDGTHHLIIVSEDMAGNQSEPADLGIWTIDTESPDTPVVDNVSFDSEDPNDRITKNNTLTITGTAEPRVEVKAFFVNIITSSKTHVGSTYADGVGNFLLTTKQIPDGTWRIIVTAKDLAGNESELYDLDVWTIDTGVPLAPSITAIGQDSGGAGDFLTRDSTLTVSGGIDSAEAGTTVIVYSDNVAVGRAVVNLDGSYSVTTSTLSEGPHVLKIRCKDTAGNESEFTAAGTWMIDTIAPPAPVVDEVVSDTGTPGDLITSAHTLTISGTGEPGTTIKVYENVSGTYVLIGTTIVLTDSSYIVTTSLLPSGVHVISVTNTDLAGNESAHTSIGSWTMLSVPRLIRIMNVSSVSVSSDTGESRVDKITKDNTITVYGKGTSQYVINVYADDIKVGTGSIDGTGHFSVTTYPLPDGCYDLAYTVTPFSNVGKYNVVLKDIGNGVMCVAVLDPITEEWEVCESPTIVQTKSPHILRVECSKITIYLYALKFPNPDLLPDICYDQSSGSSEYIPSEVFTCTGTCTYIYSELFESWVAQSGTCESIVGYTCPCTEPPSPDTISPHPVQGDTWETTCV